MTMKLNHDKNYLTMLNASAGTDMFRHLYMTDDTGAEFDAAENGNKSCALFVTGILTMFGRIDNMHATSSGTYRYISTSSDWQQVSEPTPGDVVFWDKIGNTTGHVGFYLGENSAISNVDAVGQPQKHELKMADGREPLSFWRYTK